MIRTLREWLIAAGILASTAFLAAVLVFADKAQQIPLQNIDLYSGTPPDTKTLQLDKRALDEAYHMHLIKLWGVWLAGGAKDPKFFTNGLANARRAYNQASKQISDREAGLKAADPPF